MRGSTDGEKGRRDQRGTTGFAIWGALLVLAVCAQALPPAPAAAEVNQAGGGECVPLQWIPLWGTRANGEPCLLGAGGGSGAGSGGGEDGSGGAPIDDGRNEVVVVAEVTPCEKPADCLPPDDLGRRLDRLLGFEKDRQPTPATRKPGKAAVPKKKPPASALCRKIKSRLRAEFAKQFSNLDLEYVVTYVREIERDPGLRKPWLDSPAKLVAAALKEWDGKGCDAALDWRKA